MSLIVQQRKEEPLPIVQKIREILEHADIKVEPIVYHLDRVVMDAPSTVIDGWKDAPVYVDVEIRFRVDLRKQ